MFATINTDAYERSGLKPILIIEGGLNDLEPNCLENVCQSIGTLEGCIYAQTAFSCGSEDFQNDLIAEKDHFICLVRSENKDIGYLVAWRRKVKIDSALNSLLEDGITLFKNEKESLLTAINKAASRDKTIEVIYISDVAILDAFRRSEGRQHPPIFELLGLFAAWAKPEPNKTVFLHAETRMYSRNLANSLAILFPDMLVTQLLDKEFWDERNEKMYAQIYQITAKT